MHDWGAKKGDPGEPRLPSRDDGDPAELALVHAQEEDLRERIDDARRRERKHWMRALFGISPSALIVGLGLLMKGELLLLVILSALVTFGSLWRARSAAAEAERLAEELDQLEAMHLLR